MSLDYEVTACIKNLITASPPLPELYKKMKERIISTYALSSESRLRKLLKGQVITDVNPSQILCRLRNLNDEKCDDSIMWIIFLDHLPSQCRSILASGDIIDV